MVMNLSSLATVWWQHHRPGPQQGSRGGPERVLQFLKKELELSETQVKQFVQLQREHFQKTGEIQESIRGLKYEYFGELSASSFDEKKADRLADEIGRKQAEFEKVSFSHFLDLKNLCTLEQRKKLNAIFEELLRKMAPPPGKPPPHAPGHPPPPERRRRPRPQKK